MYPFVLAIDLRNLKIKNQESVASDSMIEKIRLADEISCLAILLEPLYWPKIINQTTFPSPNCSALKEFESQLRPYKERILEYIKQLDPEIWQSYHERLRIEAARLDDNHELYILLRLSPWVKRKNIKGNIGGALWLRHIAEVIRLAFEEVHGVQWSEEDEAFGIWREGAKTKLYGSERPIQNALTTRPHIAFEFGLHTGSTVRWYVEGETEYQAVLYALPKAALSGIEIINLKGVFKEKQKNMLRLEENLLQDKILRRFVFISCDNDVEANLKFLREQIIKDNIVGYINCNSPDFEFENLILDSIVDNKSL
jgi:hypothetical protein